MIFYWSTAILIIFIFKPKVIETDIIQNKLYKFIIETYTYNSIAWNPLRHKIELNNNSIDTNDYLAEKSKLSFTITRQLH